MSSLSDKLSELLDDIQKSTDSVPTWTVVETAAVEAAKLAVAHERSRQCLEALAAERAECAKIVDNAARTRWRSVNDALLYVSRMIRLRNKL